MKRHGSSWRRVLRQTSSVLLLFLLVSLSSSNASVAVFWRKWWGSYSPYNRWWSISAIPRGGGDQNDLQTRRDDNVDAAHGAKVNVTENGSNKTFPSSPLLEKEFHREPSLEELLGMHQVDSMMANATVGEGRFETDDLSDLTTEESTELESKRLLFLDRIAWISASWMRREKDAEVDSEESTTRKSLKPEELDVLTPQSNLSLPGRHFHIVTTASLPWFTGTAVNPLLRAAYLHRRTQQLSSNDTRVHQRWVTLVVPWLELPEDQQELYGKVFADPTAQEDYIRSWLRNEADMPDVACAETGLQIIFYPARYHSGLRSIFAMGDMLRVVEETGSPMDVCVLEEPEHVNWFRAPGDGWTKKFKYVVGVVHTNYKEYASSHYSGLWTAPAISMLSSAMVRAYCHKVIKLSPVLQTYAPEKEAISNVHGVRSEFLKEGMQRSDLSSVEFARDDADSTGAYYIGKLLWAKGLDLLLELEDYYKQCTGKYFEIDIYGSGPESAVIMKAFRGRRSQVSSETINDQNNSTNGAARNGSRRRTPGSRIFDTTLSIFGGGTTNAPGNNARNGRNRRRPGSRILRTTLSIFGGTRGSPSNEAQPNGEQAKPSVVLPSLETIQQNAKRKLAKIKQTLDSVDLPQTFAELRREPIPVLPSLETIQQNAKRKLAKIKQTLDSVDLPQTFAELRREPIPVTFPGRVDHAELKRYKIFVNPSVSEVLCTTTAEALAMGKFAIIPVHPSNQFFMQFPNCLGYRNKFEFVANLRWAMTHDPDPLTPELARHFTWEAATDRFIEASGITVREALERERLGRSKLDERIAWFHNEIGKGATGDMLRKIFGGGPVSHQNKYVKEKGKIDQETPAGEEDTEDEDDGLSRKFRRSAFAEALRNTVGDISSFIQ